MGGFNSLIIKVTAHNTNCNMGGLRSTTYFDSPHKIYNYRGLTWFTGFNSDAERSELLDEYNNLECGSSFSTHQTFISTWYISRKINEITTKQSVLTIIYMDF